MNKSNLHVRAIYASLWLSLISFVWFYDSPLSADIPKHIAVAKAVVDYITIGSTADSVYQPLFAISPYALPQILLVPLILVFGVDWAWKIALSLYVMGFLLAVDRLVGKINPDAGYSRLLGFPLALSMIFHWGFWPFMVGLIAALFATAASLGKSEEMPGVKEVSLRLLTFLCHPVSALSVGLFDVFRLFLGPVRQRSDWLRKLGYLWLLWLPSIMVVLVMLAGSAKAGRNLWGGPAEQLLQLVRPFYIYKDVIVLMPLVLAVAMTFLMFRSQALTRSLKIVPLAGIAVMMVGCLVPRIQFMGSWENGIRVVFYGGIIVVASWSVLESKYKSLIIVWAFLGTAISLWQSHILWQYYDSAFAETFNVFSTKFSGYQVKRQLHAKGSAPIMLGNNLDIWTWTKGITVDAANDAAWGTGPAKYIGLSPEREPYVKTVILHWFASADQAAETCHDSRKAIAYCDSRGVFVIEESR